MSVSSLYESFKLVTRWWLEDSLMFTPQMTGPSGLLSVQGIFIYSSTPVSHANPNFFPVVIFRSLLSQGLAGIQPVCIPGIEDVSYLIFSRVHFLFIIFNIRYWKTLTIAGGCNRYGGRSLVLPMENSANSGKARTRQLLPCLSKHSLTKFNMYC